MKLYRTILYFCLCLTVNCSLLTVHCFASERNIFGLHLTQVQDINSASKVINSQGGDWGWATIVIRTDQLDRNAWQDFFNNCRKLHIIPIVRLATIMENNYWKKPDLSDIDDLANFLNSLNWPTQQQHITLFNEINHGQEWGGAVDIKNFTDISIYAYQKFKSLNPNFVVLSTALDLAAPDKSNQFMSAANVYQQIHLYRPEYFDNFDALATHYYPQNSPRNHSWELNLLKKMGVKNNFPVYITETGWPHREGEVYSNQYYTAQTSANLLLQDFNLWQKDNRVIAVTPFIYNFPHPPFDHFSWLDQSETLYPAYQKVVNTPKNQNKPHQITNYQIVSNHLPFILISDTDYLGKITLKNIGQSIWGETKFCLNPQTTQNIQLEAICTSSELVYPNQTGTFDYKLKIKNDPSFKDRTFISWDKLPPLEISPISSSGTIYSPKTSIKDKIIQYVQSFFI